MTLFDCGHSCITMGPASCSLGIPLLSEKFFFDLTLVKLLVLVGCLDMSIFVPRGLKEVGGHISLSKLPVMNQNV